MSRICTLALCSLLASCSLFDHPPLASCSLFDHPPPHPIPVLVAVRDSGLPASDSGLPRPGSATTWREGPTVWCSVLWCEGESEARCEPGEVAIGVDCGRASPRFMTLVARTTVGGALCRWRDEAPVIPGTQSDVEHTSLLQGHALAACVR